MLLLNGGVNMALNDRKRAVGVFSNRTDAEHALSELRDAGFNMDKVSVIAKDADRTGDIAGVETQKSVGNKADEGAATGAVTGSVLGGITGLLVGLGTLAIPGVGPVLLAGEIATALATTAAGAGIGAAAGGLLGALAGLGIPEERAKVYSDRVSHGDYLLIVEGTDAESRRAETILRNRGIQHFGIYNVPDGVDNYAGDRDATRTDYVNDMNVDDSKVTIIDRRDATI
jgi:Heat induced stress protein YflT